MYYNLLSNFMSFYACMIACYLLFIFSLKHLCSPLFTLYLTIIFYRDNIIRVPLFLFLLCIIMYLENGVNKVSEKK